MIVFADVQEKITNYYFIIMMLDGKVNFPVINTKAKGKKKNCLIKNEPLELECKAFINWVTVDIRSLRQI